MITTPTYTALIICVGTVLLLCSPYAARAIATSTEPIPPLSEGTLASVLPATTTTISQTPMSTIDVPQSTSSQQTLATSTPDTFFRTGTPTVASATATSAQPAVSAVLSLASSATSTTPAPAGAVTFSLRLGTEHIEAVVPLSATATSVPVVPTAGGAPVLVPAHSVLATLLTLAAATSSFSINDLVYYQSFDSFILNCISAPASFAGPLCQQWTYAVNGVYPSVGVDDWLLQDGDRVYLFFGSPRQVQVAPATVAVGEAAVATALSYDLVSGTYVPLPGVGLGVGIPQLDFTFTELSTTTTDANGSAVFVLDAPGQYAVGITTDYYFPSVPLTVVAATSTTTTGTTTTTGSSSSNGTQTTTATFNVAAAADFLVAHQYSDGSFGDALYTDWAALALSAAGHPSALSHLRRYLSRTPYQARSVTDHERHAMALMAVGIDPYRGTAVDHIAAIVAAFDGTQIGDPTLINDDIFALFPLLRAGYRGDDPLVTAVVAAIVAKQRSNGSWVDSPDVTAAALQALWPLRQQAGVSTALNQAQQYLLSQQAADGGWGNIDSTSWVYAALQTVGAPVSVTTASASPAAVLASYQQPDGGVRAPTDDPTLRVWSTSYAILGAQGTAWYLLLSSFVPPATRDDTTAVASSSEAVPVLTAEPVVAGVATSSLLSAANSVVGAQSILAAAMTESSPGWYTGTDQTRFTFATSSTTVIPVSTSNSADQERLAVAFSNTAVPPRADTLPLSQFGIGMFLVGATLWLARSRQQRR